MGQRHQVYAILPNSKVIGIHHQWLYGQTAIRMLRNALRFMSEQQRTDYGVFSTKSVYGADSQQKALESLYSIDWTIGYHHQVHTLDAECEDPRRGDNNDGITIIDLSGASVKYCFMSIDHLEGTGEQPETFRPLSAEQYYTHYYPEGHPTAGFDTDSAAILNELSTFEVLKLADVKKHFPAMFKPQLVRA